MDDSEPDPVIEDGMTFTARTTLEATFRLRYTASDGKRHRAGALVQAIRYTRTNGRWLVSGIQTIEREKP